MSRETRHLFQDLKDVSEGDWNPVKVARLLRCSVRQARRYVSEERKASEPELKRVWLKIQQKCPGSE